MGYHFHATCSNVSSMDKINSLAEKGNKWFRQKIAIQM